MGTGTISLIRAGPGGEDRYAVAEVERLVNVVRDKDRSHPTLLDDPHQLILHCHAGESVERIERLVQEQNLRLVDECPRNGHPLRHAAR